MDTDDTSYSALGLVRDPFAADGMDSGNALGIQLAIDAAVDRTLRAFRREASDQDSRGILLVKSSRLPASYPVAILTRVTSGLMRDGAEGSGLFLHVPLDMMRVGRVRAVLNTTAESFAGRSLELTLGPWIAGLVADLATSGGEAEGVDKTMLATVRTEFSADPGAAFVSYFGAPEMLRMDGDADDMAMLMRLSSSRQDALESDPDETADAGVTRDDVEDDPLRDAFTISLSEEDEGVALLPDGGTDELLAFRRWVISSAREVSPVLARGLEAYIAQGVASMTEELKISKAPTKTLIALLKILSGRYGTIAVVFDRLEMWPGIPEDLRGRILETMRALREAVDGLAVFSVILDPQDAAEVAETFSDAARVMWDLPEVENLFNSGAPFDAAVVGGWLESAAVSPGMPTWGQPLIDAVPEGVTIEQGCGMLSSALRAAAAAGRNPMPEDVREAMSTSQAD